MLNLENEVDEAKVALRERLQANDLELAFTVKIHELTQSNWVACYRAGTFRRGGRGIFWVSPDFFAITAQTLQLDPESEEFQSTIKRELLTTLAHEMIHGIQDLVAMFEQRMSDFNEEEAEDLGRRLAEGTSISNTPLLQTLFRHLDNQ